MTPPVPFFSRDKLLEWVKRYGLAEVVSVFAAVGSSLAVRAATGSEVAAAFAGAWGETAAYAGVIVVQDLATARSDAADEGRELNSSDHGGLIAGWIAEFGPAGIIDTFISRPIIMGAGAHLLGPKLGTVVGKFAADIVFYLPVIVAYERRQAARRDT
jgi:hypothetical protein